MKNSKKNAASLASFLRNVSKLDMYVHTRTTSPIYGTVTLRKAAIENNGKRLYSISSKVIHSGSYTTAGLRKALTEIQL